MFNTQLMFNQIVISYIYNFGDHTHLELCPEPNVGIECEIS
jgi:hypothetical protein